LLLDDLDSELDLNNFSTFLEVISGSGMQAMLTTLHPERVEAAGCNDVRLFHVEHGSIEQVV
jgi:recombinational DNA repair ATPase RecF